MKYYKLSKDDKDLNVILACENEEYERKAFEKYGKEYSLTECEAPKDVQLLNEDPNLGLATPYMMHNHRDLASLVGGYANERRVIWEGPCCSRCSNRFNSKLDFCFNHHTDINCQRFKLERL